MKRFLFTALLALPLAAFAQIPHDSLWSPMRYFIGSWVGEGEGKLGIGKYERSYQWALNGSFLQIRNKAAYAPQEKSPQGEIHEDIGYLSFNSVENRFMLRQFHVEGYIIEYKMDKLAADQKRYNFISFEIENIPVGWRARESYEIINQDEYVEVFELAPPGRDYEVYSKATMKRRKPRFNG